jgi:hypothetical protein
MNQFQADLIAVYKNVMREVEGGSADFDELVVVMNRNGIEIDDDGWPVEEASE